MSFKNPLQNSKNVLFNFLWDNRKQKQRVSNQKNKLHPSKYKHYNYYNM